MDEIFFFYNVEHIKVMSGVRERGIFFTTPSSSRRAEEPVKKSMNITETIVAQAK